MTDAQKLQHKFTLSVSTAYQQHNNVKYPTRASLNTVADIYRAVIWDHIPAKTDGTGRKLENLIESDCAVFDVDNPIAESRIPELIKTGILTEGMTKTEQLKALHAAGLITLPDDLRRMFSDVEMIIYTSKNNNKAKNGQDPAVDGQKKTPLIPAPRYHVLLPFGETLTREEYQGYTAFMRERYANIPGVDPVSFKPSQYMDGNRNTVITHIPGSKTILDFVWNVGWSKDGTRSVTGVDDIFSQPEVVKSEQAAKVFDDDISTKVRKYDEKFFEGDRHPHLDRIIGCVIHSKTDQEAQRKIEAVLRKMTPPLPDEEVGRYLSWVVHDCALFKLAKAAKSILANLCGIRDKAVALDAARTAFSEFAKKYPYIERAKVNQVFDDVRKELNMGKKEGKERLTTGIVEREFEELGVDIRQDDIDRKTYVFNIPDMGIYAAKNNEKSLKDNPMKTVVNIFEAFFAERYTGTGKTAEYIEEFAVNHHFNSVHEMMASQGWDGVDRIKILCDEVIHVQSEIERVFVTKWLHQTCAMAHNDDGKFDAEIILTLQSERQGSGKTMLFRRLALDNIRWLKTGVTLNPDSKDSLITATSKWIIELGEVDKSLANELRNLKSHTTQTFDSYRAPYDKYETEYVRRCSFCATVNPGVFLKEVEGRRWGIVSAERLNPETVLKTMTDDFVRQLWTQVYTQLYIPNPVGYHLSMSERLLQADVNLKATESFTGEAEILPAFDWDCDDLMKWRCLAPATISKFINGNLSGRVIGKALSKVRKNDSRILRFHTRAGFVWFMPPLRERYFQKQWNGCMGIIDKCEMSDSTTCDDKARAELAILLAYESDKCKAFRDDILLAIKDARREEYGLFLDKAIAYLVGTNKQAEAALLAEINTNRLLS